MANSPGPGRRAESMTIDEALLLLCHVKAPFRTFMRYDWDGFAGCESDNPLIAEFENVPVWGSGCVIIDGPTYTVHVHVYEDVNIDAGWDVDCKSLNITSSN